MRVPIKSVIRETIHWRQLIIFDSLAFDLLTKKNTNSMNEFPFNTWFLFESQAMCFNNPMEIKRSVVFVITEEPKLSTPGPCLVRFLGPGQKAHEPKPHELSQKRMSEEFRMS